MNYMTQFAIIGGDQYFSEGHFKIQPEIPKGKGVTCRVWKRDLLRREFFCSMQKFSFTRQTFFEGNLMSFSKYSGYQILYEKNEIGQRG